MNVLYNSSLICGYLFDQYQATPRLKQCENQDLAGHLANDLLSLNLSFLCVEQRKSVQRFICALSTFAQEGDVRAKVAFSRECLPESENGTQTYHTVMSVLEEAVFSEAQDGVRATLQEMQSPVTHKFLPPIITLRDAQRFVERTKRATEVAWSILGTYEKFRRDVEAYRAALLDDLIDECGNVQQLPNQCS